MRILWRAIVEVVREGPRLYAEACDRSILRYHAPFDLEGDGTGPAVCLPCKTDWPCDEFITTDRRIDDWINRGAA